VNADNKEWEDIDIDIDIDELNEILGEKFKSGKKMLKDKEMYYAELLKNIRNERCENKDEKKSAKKSKKEPRFKKDEKYMAYGVAAFIMAFIAYHLLRKN